MAKFRKLRMNWRILAAACLGLGAGYALTSAAPNLLVSPSQAQTPNNADLREKNVSTVRAALENAKGGHLELVEPLFASDFVLYESEGLPFGGVYRGWKGYTEVLDKLKVFFSDSKHISREFIAIDDTRVMVHFDLDAHIAKNGQHVQMPIVAIWEVKDGKIASIRPFFFDTKRIADLAAM